MAKTELISKITPEQRRQCDAAYTSMVREIVSGIVQGEADNALHFNQIEKAYNRMMNEANMLYGMPLWVFKILLNKPSEVTTEYKELKKVAIQIARQALIQQHSIYQQVYPKRSIHNLPFLSDTEVLARLVELDQL